MSAFGMGLLRGISKGTDKYNELLTENKKMAHDDAKWMAETERQQNLENLRSQNKIKELDHEYGLKGKSGNIKNWHEFTGQAWKRIENMDPEQLEMEYALAVDEQGYQGTINDFTNAYVVSLAKQMAASGTVSQPSGVTEGGPAAASAKSYPPEIYDNIDIEMAKATNPKQLEQQVEKLKKHPALYKYAREKLDGIKENKTSFLNNPNNLSDLWSDVKTKITPSPHGVLNSPDFQSGFVKGK